MDLVNEIPEAINQTNRILIDSLKGYTCLEDENCLPYGFEMYSGGFCQAYPLIKSNLPKKCLRFWTDDKARKDNLKHIENISGFFDRHSNPYIVRYKYEAQALKLNNGIIIPGVVMDWVEGDKLIDYVKKNYHNRGCMKSLAHNFFAMAMYMNNAGMSHGDLSGDNIIVSSSGQLVLVDYDSFYVPLLDVNVKQPTCGIRCYQHPERKIGMNIGPKDDYFSQKIIYLSLLTIAVNPNIFKVDVDKGLLFQDQDLTSAKAFSQSKMYNSIKVIEDKEVIFHLQELLTAITGPLSSVSVLAEYKDIYSQPPVKRVEYCIKCGHKFPDQTDIYCTQCGAIRLQYTSN